MAATLTVKTCDGKVFHIIKEVIDTSKMLKDMVEDLDDLNDMIKSGKKEPEEPAILELSEKVLEQVTLFCCNFAVTPIPPIPPVAPDHDHVNVTKWDEDFFNPLSHEELEAIILAANFLDNKPLLEVSCKIMANRIKGLPFDTVVKMLKLEAMEPDKLQAFKKEHEMTLK